MTEVKVVQDEKTNTIRQWAIDVLAFSSEYNVFRLYFHIYSTI